MKYGQEEQASIIINNSSVNLDYFYILFGTEFEYFIKLNEGDEFTLLKNNYDYKIITGREGIVKIVPKKFVFIKIFCAYLTIVMCIKIAIYQVFNDESIFLIISIVFLVSYIVSFMLMVFSDIFDNNTLSLAFDLTQFLIASLSLSKDICLLIQNVSKQMSLDNFSKVRHQISQIWTIYALVVFIIYAK